MRPTAFLAIAAAGAAVAVPRLDAMPAAAIEGWHGPGSEETDPRRRALAWALLAPNPHNLQSWAVDLSRPGTIVLYTDAGRLLPQTDPFSRQILIGHGCFLEILALAAAADGYRTEVTLFPDGMWTPDRPVARIDFAQRSAPAVDPLFAEVPRRRTVKSRFEARALDPAHKAALLAGRRAAMAPLALSPSGPPSLSATTGVPFSVSATVSDPGTGDAPTCAINWGDGASDAGTVTAGTCSGSHTYAAPGDVVLSITATDGAGATGAAAALVHVTALTGPVVSITPSNASPVTGEMVTLSAAVTDPNTPTPHGKVEFLDGTTVLATRAVNAGVAAYRTSRLALGAHSIVARWLPSATATPVEPLPC